MVALSAPDAISPALRRMRTFLFRPFRLGTFLKLSLVAILTEGFGSSFNVSWPGNHPAHHVTTVTHVTNVSFMPTSGPWTPQGFSPGWIAVAVAAAIGAIAVCLFLAYLITRLRFAYFHCLLGNTREIRPGWRLYRDQATRFFWMNLAVILCFVLAVTVVALSFAAAIWKVVHDSGGHPPLGEMIALILPAVLALLVVIVAAVALDVILRDFMLPHYALENATAGQAWTASWQRFCAEKGAFTAYALLRVFLPLAAWMGLLLVLFLPGVFFALAVVLVEVGIHAGFADAAGGVYVAGIALEILVGVMAAALVFLVGISVGGPLSTAVREYALLFYGGRYQLLGDALSSPPDAGVPAPGMA